MQPLKATARPSCGSSIGWGPASERSMIFRRGWPRPAPSCAHTPAPSGPRAAMAADIRLSAAASAGAPSKRSSPAIPHTERARVAYLVGGRHSEAAARRRSTVGRAGLDKWPMSDLPRSGEPRNVRGNDLPTGYVAGFMPPLIGISTSEMRAPERTRALAKGEPPTRELALGLSYPRSIEIAGAVPVVIPPLELDRIDALLARLGGLVISGGPDIHPAAYGEAPVEALGPTEPDLDAFEIALVRRADALGMPVLGICRGLQVVNVARGGTLVQDIADHRQEESGRVPTHKIVVKEGSMLERLMGPGEHAVNSFHHQAVKQLGAKLRPVAWSPDG